MSDQVALVSVESHVKAGTSRAQAAHRRKLFVEAYIQNGGNAKRAAIAAGYSERSAEYQGSVLLREPKISAAIRQRQVDLQRKSEMTTERIIEEISRLVFSDIRAIYNHDGTLKPMSEWSEEAATAVSSVEVIEGPGGIRTSKVKLWDKNSALDKAMKHLGLFDKDNRQQKYDPLAELLRQIDGKTRGI